MPGRPVSCIALLGGASELKLSTLSNGSSLQQGNSLPPATFGRAPHDSNSRTKQSLDCERGITSLEQGAMLRVVHSIHAVRDVVVENELRTHPRHEKISDWIMKIRDASLELSDLSCAEFVIISLALDSRDGLTPSGSGKRSGSTRTTHFELPSHNITHDISRTNVARLKSAQRRP